VFFVSNVVSVEINRRHYFRNGLRIINYTFYVIYNILRAIFNFNTYCFVFGIRIINFTIILYQLFLRTGLSLSFTLLVNQTAYVMMADLDCRNM